MIRHGRIRRSRFAWFMSGLTERTGLTARLQFEKVIRRVLGEKHVRSQ
ncbi:MAG: hypothetical protein HY895_06540 [Deltaproteobacteria bacterium]|nr:hypothetical protein [Deltaproteobacteria bacterium]